MPPRLHWGWVLLFSALTRGFFVDVWLLVQAIWIRKVTGKTAIRNWALVNVCKYPLGLLVGVVYGASLAYQDPASRQAHLSLVTVEVIFALVGLVVYLRTIYKMRSALEGEPIAIPLGGVMTFFFGPLYFQYFLRNWVPLTYQAPILYPQYTYPNVPPQA